MFEAYHGKHVALSPSVAGLFPLAGRHGCHRNRNMPETTFGWGGHAYGHDVDQPSSAFQPPPNHDGGPDLDHFGPNDHALRREVADDNGAWIGWEGESHRSTVGRDHPL